VKSEVRIHPQARRDMIEHALYIAEDAPEAADAFLQACENCFAELAKMPEIHAL